MAARKKAAPKKAVAKKKAAPKRTGAAKQTAGKLSKIKVAAETAKFTGFEPEWEGVEVTEKNRNAQMMNSFNWYNYYCDHKDAHTFVMEYLHAAERKDDAKAFKKLADRSINNAIGWLARMSLKGWELVEDEVKRIEADIASALAKAQPEKVEEKPEEDKVKSNKPTIQDRMREKAAEAGGEIEGMFDEYVALGAPAKHTFMPIGALKVANILPQHVPGEIEHWERIREEFVEAHAGKDKDLVEGYGHFSKIQLRRITQFIDLIIADYHGYVAFKKASKPPRKRKVKTPAQLVVKLKHLKEFPEFKLTGVDPTKIVGAKEMFVYDTKKRKLQYLVADEYAQTLTVKNSSVVGFDVTKSSQKTLRKPADQVKEFMAASKPNSRKYFEKVKAVETKLTGRFNENMIILKVW